LNVSKNFVSHCILQTLNLVHIKSTKSIISATLVIKELVFLLVDTSENVRMQSELEAKMSMKNVEDYAENTLGLTKLDKSQIVYMEVQSDNVIEVAPEKRSFFVTVRDKLDDLLAYILG